MKDIVIIANFCRDFSKNDNGRFQYLCKELSKTDQVEIITSDFSHSLKTKKGKLTHDWPFTITFLDEPGYQKNISIKRFWSHRKWGRNVGKYLEKRKKPDIIDCAVPSLTAALSAMKYCKRNKVKFVVDIQDLWPEAFYMALNVPILSNLLFFPFKRIADKVYRNADEICGVSKSYVERALKKNVKNAKGHVAFLGTELETFDEGATVQPYVFKENKDDLWVGYCGSLSASYDIGCVLNALQIIREKKNTMPRMIIMGDGLQRESFAKTAQEKELDVVFTGRLPYDQMCATLKQCDILINPITKRSAASIINKHGDYAAAGLPVINTQESSEYRSLIEEYHMGLNCKNGDADDVAQKIMYLMDHPEERYQMGCNSRKCAEERFDRRNSYLELLSVFT